MDEMQAGLPAECLARQLKRLDRCDRRRAIAGSAPITIDHISPDQMPHTFPPGWKLETEFPRRLGAAQPAFRMAYPPTGANVYNAGMIRPPALISSAYLAAVWIA